MSGWGRGSGSRDLHQVHVELVNQSVCADLLDTTRAFNPDLMICAGNVEAGGRDTCSVGLFENGKWEC